MKPGAYFFRGRYVSLGYVHYSLAERGVRRKHLLKVPRMGKENKQFCKAVSRKLFSFFRVCGGGTRNSGRVLNRTVGVRCSNITKIGVLKADHAKIRWWAGWEASP